VNGEPGMSVTSLAQAHGPAAFPAPRRLPRHWLYLAPGIAFTAVFFLLPLALMAVHSLHRRQSGRIITEASFANYAKFIEKEFLWGSLVNSLELTALTVIATLPVAYALAAAIAFAVPKAWRGVVLMLVALPFFTSYVVRTYAWLLVLADKGVVNSALLSVGLIETPLALANTRAGVIIVFVHYFTMIMTLSIYVNLAQIPPNMIRAARDLGASGLQVFLRVVLPLSIPGTMVGVFLTMVFAIGDYVTPQIIGGSNELLLPQAVMLQVGRLADTPMAAALSVILMGVIGLMSLGFARWLRLDRG
jgi:spermidine/putrescine transport system permease protein